MTKQTATETRFRPTPLAASMALLWSGATLAAPGEPVVERIEPEYLLGESSLSAEVNVSWRRDFGDPAVTARYLVNEQLVATRTVDTGHYENDGSAQSGGETLTFHRDGEYEIVVELCNADGCTDSVPTLVDVWNPWGEMQAEPTPATDLDAVMAENQEIVAQLTDGQFVPQQQLWLASFATLVGQTLFSSTVSYGVNDLFDFVLGKAGGTSEDLSGQLSELSQGVAQLNDQISQLTKYIQDLQDSVNWGFFPAQHSNAVSQINRIYEAYGKVQDWLQGDIVPGDHEWKLRRDNVVMAVTDLVGARFDATGGIIDMRDGSIEQLLEAVPQTVSSVGSYYDIVDAYRDYYRSALAIGVLTLDLIDTHYDESHLTLVDRDTALEVGRRGTWKIYAMGVAPATLGDASGNAHDLVYFRGSTTGYAKRGFHFMDRSTRDVYTAFEQQQRDQMTQSNFSGTLETWLTNRGYATRYLINDEWAQSRATASTLPTSKWSPTPPTRSRLTCRPRRQRRTWT